MSERGDRAKFTHLMKKPQLTSLFVIGRSAVVGLHEVPRPVCAPRSLKDLVVLPLLLLRVKLIARLELPMLVDLQELLGHEVVIAAEDYEQSRDLRRAMRRRDRPSVANG